MTFRNVRMTLAMRERRENRALTCEPAFSPQLKKAT